MKLSLAGLRAHCPALPDDPEAVRLLLDDAGIEVKGVSQSGEDTVIAVELLANRGDHRCYAGVALELAARLDGRVVPLPVAGVTVSSPDAGATGMRVAGAVTGSGCLSYTLTPLRVVDDKAELPASVRRILALEGGLTGSAIVDASNAVSLELGQPTHAFDADQVKGGVQVRPSLSGEVAWLLGEDELRELPTGTLVIADDVKILAIAGVIGCEESRVTGRTTRVLLESAVFDPVEVRKAASALGVQTSASQRFERGGDPTAVLAGVGRLVRLLEDAGAAEVTGPSIVLREWPGPLPRVQIDFEDLGDFLGVRLTPQEAADRLTRYGLTHVGDGLFEVPGHRIWDLVEAQDLYEEVARGIGYDALPTTLPAGSIGAARPAAEEGAWLAGEVLVSHGFYEVFTDGFYNRELLRQLGVEPGSALDEHVATANAADRRYALLKNNCLAQAVEAVSTNVRYRTADVRLFELATVFVPDAGANNGVCTEKGVLWAIAAGSLLPDTWSDDHRQQDFFSLKGIAEEIAHQLGRDLTVTVLDEKHPLSPFLHPFRSASLYLDGRQAGVLGEVHPAVVKRFGIKEVRPIYLELARFGLLPAQAGPRPTLEDSPPIDRMLDFVLPQGVRSTDVEQVLRAAAPARLRGLDVVDVFTDPAQFGEGARSITYKLLLAVEPTPTSEELNAEIKLMIDAVASSLGERGVRLR
ncbi:phenylalanine--tRNA ligase subunit beta [Nonomuraea mesophila]|uniref:phenylalanine--tRNA ligase n=1 Tax=Nonomuraea mesophila TaxID=2530382 RepID=A0A4V2ZBJ4_9ACTN|nr:phenylalanine--tRNA ligase subunit beta [Nonomuraea mesophila]TDE57739.1 phenylalanine--tRNA ligase subunit beta [Nonomuraea mesophila]